VALYRHWPCRRQICLGRRQCLTVDCTLDLHFFYVYVVVSQIIRNQFALNSHYALVQLSLEHFKVGNTFSCLPLLTPFADKLSQSIDSQTCQEHHSCAKLPLGSLLASMDVGYKHTLHGLLPLSTQAMHNFRYTPFCFAWQREVNQGILTAIESLRQ